MSIVHFTRATNPAKPGDEVHINSDAILFVEQPPEDQVGATAIRMMGLKTGSLRVSEALGQVLCHLPVLVQAQRHYHAGEPAAGASKVHIALHNVSHLSPNVPQNPVFWTVRFKDESELRILPPLPTGL